MLALALRRAGEVYRERRLSRGHGAVAFGGATRRCYRCPMPAQETRAPARRVRLRPERSARSRRIFNDTLLASLGVVVAVAVLAFGGLALDWWVFHDRYGLGFYDYLRVVVF